VNPRALRRPAIPGDEERHPDPDRVFSGVFARPRAVFGLRSV